MIVISVQYIAWQASSRWNTRMNESKKCKGNSYNRCWHDGWDNESIGGKMVEVSPTVLHWRAYREQHQNIINPVETDPHKSAGQKSAWIGVLHAWYACPVFPWTRLSLSAVERGVDVAGSHEWCMGPAGPLWFSEIHINIYAKLQTILRCLVDKDCWT